MVGGDVAFQLTWDKVSNWWLQTANWSPKVSRGRPPPSTGCHSVDLALKLQKPPPALPSILEKLLKKKKLKGVNCGRHLACFVDSVELPQSVNHCSLRRCLILLLVVCLVLHSAGEFITLETPLFPITAQLHDLASRYWYKTAFLGHTWYLSFAVGGCHIVHLGYPQSHMFAAISCSRMIIALATYSGLGHFMTDLPWGIKGSKRTWHLVAFCAGSYGFPWW